MGDMNHMSEMTPTAVVVLLWRHGEPLMVSRRDRTAWGLPGGKVDPGETPADAAVREVAEETGLRLVASDLWEVHRGEEGGHLVIAYAAPDPGGELAPLDGEAVAQWGDWRLLTGPVGAFPAYNAAVIAAHSMAQLGDRWYSSRQSLRVHAVDAALSPLADESLRPALERVIRTGDASPAVVEALEAPLRLAAAARARREEAHRRAKRRRVVASPPQPDHRSARCGRGSGCLQCHSTDLLGRVYSDSERRTSYGCGGPIR